MLILFGEKGTCSAAVEAALEISNLPYTLVETAPCMPLAGLAQLKQVNPKAQVPTLVLEDGSILTESAAILVHIGLIRPNSDLLSTDPFRRAQQIRGLVYVAANCDAGVGILNHQDSFRLDDDEPTRITLLTRGRAHLYQLWETFADQFPGTPWLAGERLGALDLLAATVSLWSGARKHLQVARPDLHGILERVALDPRVAPVWRRNWLAVGAN